MFDLSVYKAGETEAKELFNRYGYIVKDVSDNSNYFNKDIDLIVTNPSGVTKRVEVKADRRIADTGNLFIEYLNPRSKGGYGWYHFCQADLLYYGDMINQVFYIFDFKKLKEYISKTSKSLRSVNTFDGSVGYALPLEAVKDMANIVSF